MTDQLLPNDDYGVCWLGLSGLADRSTAPNGAPIEAAARQLYYGVAVGGAGAVTWVRMNIVEMNMTRDSSVVCCATPR